MMRETSRRRVPLNPRGMMRREDIFRFAGAAKADPAVERWLTDDTVELRTIAHLWFTRIRQCGDDVRELMHDGCPVACVGTAAFAYVNSFRSHVNVGFFYGASLEDPAALLQGSGKRMRHVKLTPQIQVNAAALGELIDAAYADISIRLRSYPATGGS
jgi:hypothetical protein